MEALDEEHCEDMDRHRSWQAYVFWHVNLGLLSNRGKEDPAERLRRMATPPLALEPDSIKNQLGLEGLRF